MTALSTYRRRSSIEDIFRDIDSIFNHRPHLVSSQIDFEDLDDYYLAHIDLPGLKEEDITVELDGNQLQISGERKGRQAGKFERSIRLNDQIDSEKIEANYEAGVLSITLPKVEVTPSRKIPIGSKNLID